MIFIKLQNSPRKKQTEDYVEKEIQHIVSIPFLAPTQHRNKFTKRRPQIPSKRFSLDITVQVRTNIHLLHEPGAYLVWPFEINITLVFAYGATGAGKTHTMLGTPEDPGVIARTVRALYEKIDLMKEKNNDSLYDVSVQYLEVYNEKINDLLTDGAKGKDLPLREAGGEITISR